MIRPNSIQINCYILLCGFLLLLNCDNKKSNMLIDLEKDYTEAILDEVTIQNFNIMDTLLYSSGGFVKIISDELKKSVKIDSIFESNYISDIKAKCYISQQSCIHYLAEEELMLKEEIGILQKSKLASLIDLNSTNSCQRKLQKTAYGNFRKFEERDSVLLILNYQELNNRREIIFSNCGGGYPEDSTEKLKISGIITFVGSSYEYDGSSKFWIKFRILDLDTEDIFLYKKLLLVGDSFNLNLKSFPYEINKL